MYTQGIPISQVYDIIFHVYVRQHFWGKYINKICPHFWVTTSIYHALFNRNRSNTPAQHYRPKSMGNYVHAYIPCTPRKRVYEVPTFQQKMVLFSSTSNIFSHFPSHDPCSRRNNTTFLEVNNNYNIHFLPLLLLLLLLVLLLLLQLLILLLLLLQQNYA